MKDERLGALLDGFGERYWSVPVSFVKGKIMDWHPELSPKQIEKALHKCEEDLYYHCSVQSQGMAEPELVTEHLLAFGTEDLMEFLGVRIDGPFHEFDELQILDFDRVPEDLPEVKALKEFGRSELGLDDEWAVQLYDDCVFHQQNSLCDGESWIMDLVFQEQFGHIHFDSMEQVNTLLELARKLYMVLPNPVLKGWRPDQIPNPPMPNDSFKKYIRNKWVTMEQLIYGDSPNGRPGATAKANTQEHAQPQMMAKEKKVGRNDPCPCGSGKKYKQCCGR